MKHYIERLLDRILNRKFVDVGYEINIGIYEKVGEYIISTTIKDKIGKDISFLENYNFDYNESYAIELIEFNIKEKDIIDYYCDSTINKSFVIIDSETESNGNKLYAIIRNNRIVTIYLGKNYVKQTLEKLRVDKILKIEELKVRHGKIDG